MKIIARFVFNASLFFCHSAYSENCASLWENGFPDSPSPRTVNCLRFGDASTSAELGYAIYVSELISSDSDIQRQLAITENALQRAINKYRAFGRVPKISLVRYDRAHFRDPLAFAFTFVEFFDLNNETCPIIVYPHSQTLSDANFEQNVAHEVFHCVQKFNFKDQVSAAILGAGAGRWWFEGLAQYFSNNTFPNNNFEYMHYFPEPNQTTPFFDQSSPYSTENFWQNYANFVGAEELFNQQSFMIAAPRVQISLNLPLISEALHDYARNITRQKVMDDSGAYAPYSWPFFVQEAADIDSQELRLTFRDFALGAHEIILPKGKIWRLNLKHAPAGTKASIKKFGEDEYSDFTAVTQFTADCEGDQRAQIVITRIANDTLEQQALIQINREDNPECQCDNPRAEKRAALPACVVGVWTVPMEAVQHSSKYDESVFGMTTRLNSFGYTLEIRADKTYTELLKYDHQAQAPSIMKPGETTMMRQRVVAQSSGTVCKLEGDTLEFIGRQQITQSLAMGSNSGAREYGPQDIRTERDYYCNEEDSGAEPPLPYPVNIDHLKAKGLR